MRPYLFAALCITLLSPAAVSAQNFADLGISDTSSFTMSAAPQYPAPYSSVTLSFLSGSIDLTNATLSIAVNGKNIYEGSVRPVAMTLGKAGSVTTAVATVSSGGTNYVQTVAIQPQDVALVVEPISSAPPLYPGKPSVPLEGSVRVVAVANLKNEKGMSVSPSALSYSWTVDDTQIANSSGIGKTTILVASPLQYRARAVSVSVMSTDGSLVGGASVSLSATDPSVRMYENDPLLGIRFDRALSGQYSIANTESTLYAAPYSFPTTQGAPLIRWFLNGAQAQTGNAITLRPTGSGQGNASLSLIVSAGDYTRATANLSLLFGAQPSTNFFGL